VEEERQRNGPFREKSTEKNFKTGRLKGEGKKKIEAIGLTFPVAKNKKKKYWVNC